MLSTYQGKRVFITGHTGFKGSWLVHWLRELGCAEITGYSLEPETCPNLYTLTDVQDHCISVMGDVRNKDTLEAVLKDAKPDIIFHMAAQPLVRQSYNDPGETYSSNVMGTVNLLEAARKVDQVAAIVVVTTDKCYRNHETGKPFVEDDPLGGHDPYSASKAMAEIATQSYYNSFFREKGVGVATARGGNVIGGGDFSTDRLIPDIIRAISRNEDVMLRYPAAIRPWQHVLDALAGYLMLGEALMKDASTHSKAYNFAPSQIDSAWSVEAIAGLFIEKLGQGRISLDQQASPHEAGVLKLDPFRALTELGWQSEFDTEKSLDLTAEWYRQWMQEEGDLLDFTLSQIKSYPLRSV